MTLSSYSPVAMFDQLTAWFITPIWLYHVAWIVGFYFLAWLVHRLAWPIASRIVQLRRFTPRTHQPGPERQVTLQCLIASTISLIAFAVATLAGAGTRTFCRGQHWLVQLDGGR